MKSFDTNVALHLVVEDDLAQCARDGRTFRRAVSEGGVFLLATVMMRLPGSFESSAKQTG